MEYVAPIGAADPNDPYVDANPAVGQEGSAVPAAIIEHPAREIVNFIDWAGLVPDGGDLTQLRQAVQAAIAAALAASHPGFDVPFLAGWADDFTGEDLVEGQVYARVKVLRDLVLQDFLVDLEVAGTGAAVIWDVTIDGVTAFTTKPQFADGSTVLVPGVFDPAMVDVPAGSIVEILVFQVGTVIRGQKATGGLKGREA